MTAEAAAGLSAEQRATLLATARGAIEHGLAHGRPPEIDPAGYPPELRRPAACFVTLEESGRLRGCIGSLEARDPLIRETVRMAFEAAFRDPRFDPLAAAELERVAIGISVIGPLEPLACASRDQLVAAIRPGCDGILVDDGRHRGTFLPAVWKDLPDPGRFVGELMRKAGAPRDHWSDSMRVWRYGCESFSEPDPGRRPRSG